MISSNSNSIKKTFNPNIKLRPDEAWDTIERLAQYENEGWNDAFTSEEVSFNYENPDVEHLLIIMERKVDTLMKNAISIMGKSESVFRLTTNKMCRPPTEPSRQEEFEHIVMNFIYNQEERIRQLKNYMQNITDEFIEFSLEVALRLKERIKENERKPRKIDKITRYPDTEDLEPLNELTYSEEVEKTLGTPIEVEPLNETKIEEVGLNCNHNTRLSSREALTFDKPKPQPQPLPNCPPLDASLGTKRGLKPLIKPHSPDRSRMKEMFDDDWGLEPKGVSPLGEELSLFDRPKEVEKVRIKETRHLEHAHLEKKRTRLRTNSKNLGDLCSQSLETASNLIHDTVTLHLVTASHISRQRQPAPTQNANLEDLFYNSVTAHRVEPKDQRSQSMKEQAYNVDRDKDHKSSTTTAISLISRRSVTMNSLRGRLSPTTTAHQGLDWLRESRAQILWPMYNMKNVDYVALLLEDFMYQADNKEISSARKEHMPYPRFTKVIIDHFISKDNTISMKNRINLHTARDDSLLGALKFVSKIEDCHKYGALIPDGMINDDIELSTAYDIDPRIMWKSKRETHKLQASGSSEGVDFESEIPDEQTGKTKDTSEGTGVKPGVPDVSKEDSSDSDDDSWGNSEDENDYFNDENDDGGNDVDSIMIDVVVNDGPDSGMDDSDGIMRYHESFLSLYFTSSIQNLISRPDVNEIASLMNTSTVPLSPPPVNPSSHLTIIP
ncbi:hypothetical protein Tco_0152399 [Tanacetum coccineum]